MNAAPLLYVLAAVLVPGAPADTANCGQSNLNSKSLGLGEAGFAEAGEGNFPWHAGIYHKQDGAWTNKCGGSLVSPRAVLTVAHCVTDRHKSSQAMAAADLQVVLGKRHRGWDHQEDHQVKKAVKEIHVPANYIGAPANFALDIAILILDSDVSTNTFVSPVCLDKSNTHGHEISSAGNVGIFAGWGRTKACDRNEECAQSDLLLYSSTPVLDYKQCVEVLQTSTHLLRVTHDKICSENGSKALLAVDRAAGGGLVMSFDNKYYVYGVTDLKLSRRGEYSLIAFTNVQDFLPWITGILKN